MKKSNPNPKPKSLKFLLSQVLIRNAVFYFLLTMFMYYVYKTNALQQKYSDNIQLLLFVLTVISFITCFMEMRLVNADGKFVMPIFRFFVFFTKILIIIINYLILYFFANYLACIIINAVIYLLVSVGVKFSFTRMSPSDTYYIDYLLTKKTDSSKLNSPIIGIIVSVVILSGSIAWLIILIVLKNNYANMMVTAAIFIILMIVALVFYSIKYYKNKKQIKNNFEKDDDLNK